MVCGAGAAGGCRVAAAMKVCAQEQEHDDHGYVLQLNCVHVAAALSPWLAAHTAAAGHECSEAAVHQFIVANNSHRHCNNEYNDSATNLS